MTTTKRLNPVHPGRILEKDYLEPLSLSQNKLARAIRVPATRINQICKEKRSVTADTALRLAEFFDTTPQFWLNLQARYDLDTMEDQRGDTIRKDVKPLEDLT